MGFFSTERATDDERGASAIFVAMWLVLIMGATALGVDISMHTHTRQDLWDALDAAALAGAAYLPDAAAAEAAADAYADANLPGLVPNIEFWCVVGEDSLTGLPDAAHIPVMCDPGIGPWTSATYPGMECNGTLCLIPCNPYSPELDKCNAMSATAAEDVDYNFAPIVGANQGSTGALTSAACKGPCGSEISTDGDIALVVDRTGSMGAADVAALQAASLSFLEGLDTTKHYVALGTLGRSNPSLTCPTRPSSSDSSGPWIPVGLSNDYDLTDNDPPDSPVDLNSASDIVKGINCLTNSSTGTNIGDPIEAAGDYLVANGRTDVPAGIVFMTDGEANRPTGSGSCDYAALKAESVKANNVAIVTIAYRLQGVDCGGTPATTVLANMASDSDVTTADDGGDGPGGLPGGCLTAASIASENADGDLFFCAPDAGLLSSVFASASEGILAVFSENTSLIRPAG